jgi:hypothetical protein
MVEVLVSAAVSLGFGVSCFVAGVGCGGGAGGAAWAVLTPAST